MKIQLPIGKVLAGCVFAHGVIVSNYMAKAIKQTEDEPGIGNEIAQAGVMVGVSIPHMALATKLWCSKSLNPTIGKKHKDESADNRFSRKASKYIEKFKDGELDIPQVLVKLAKLYDETPPETLLTRCFFFGNLNQLPDLFEAFTEVRSLYEDILNGYDVDGYVAIYDWIIAHYKNRISDNPYETGINADQWAAILSILDNDTDSDPSAIADLLEEISTKGKAYMAVNGGIETVKVFDNLHDIIEHFEAMAEPAKIVAAEQGKSLRELFRMTDADFNAITADELKAMSLDEVCDTLLGAVHWFRLQQVSAATVASLVAKAMSANPEGMKLFETKWSMAADTAKRVFEDEQPVNTDPVHLDAEAAKADLKKLEAQEDAMGFFYQDERNLWRDIAEDRFADPETAEKAVEKFILRARTNVNIPRNTIKQAELSLKELIKTHEWTHLGAFNAAMEDFIGKYDPDSPTRLHQDNNPQALSAIMNSILVTFEDRIPAEEMDAAKLRMEAVIAKYKKSAE